MSAHSQHKGFTIIEMIVSLAVFAFVITIAIGALLMLVNTNNQLQGEQSVMTNLSFALDSMTREIRTGTFYYCDARVDNNGANNIFRAGADLDEILKNESTGAYETQDCSSGKSGGNNKLQGLAFIEGGNSISLNKERILYYFDEDAGTVYRRTGTNGGESIISSGVEVKKFEFFVTGSKKLSESATEIDQPSVTIYIEATDPNDPTSKSYYLQTTVTQRTLDI